jgi:ubiquinone/menaquinone biosynthesis C-methylase UbiE
MKLNWAERLAVNNPLRVLHQRMEIRWMRDGTVLNPGSAVLEVGCGRGAGARMILERFRPGRFHALDLDMEMIKRARGYLRSGPEKSVALYVADVLRLPYGDGALDAVFGFGVLHHMPDWRGGVKEIARVLKEGGLYFLEELYPPLYQNFITRHILLHPKKDRFRSRGLNQALRAAGLFPSRVLECTKLGVLCVAAKKRG